MRRVNVNFLLVSLALFGVLLLKGRGVHEEAAATRETASVGPVAAAVKSERAPAALSAEAAVLPVVAPPVTLVKKPEPYAGELAEYTVLKKKVFLTPAEEGQRNALLKNAKVLRAMRSRLLNPPATVNEAKEQNAAIDLLLDAVRIGNSDVAVEVLREVVSDGQIEDEDLDRATRENLAGVKAEVLYQLSALKPAQAQELAGMLPGPVSRKIWQNVIAAQASNLSESAALAH